MREKVYRLLVTGTAFGEKTAATKNLLQCEFEYDHVRFFQVNG